jgi:hypothetical protein
MKARMSLKILAQFRPLPQSSRVAFNKRHSVKFHFHRHSGIDSPVLESVGS